MSMSCQGLDLRVKFSGVAESIYKAEILPSP